MTTIVVDQTLTFVFIPSIAAESYDKWQHYINNWSNTAGGKKAVDIVAVNGAPPSTAWLIEAKDFRVITNPPKPSNISGLAQFVADKVRDTLTGLSDASINATLVGEKQHAANAIACPTRRIVLHLEPHTGARSALFPAGFSTLVYQQLRQLVSNPLVLNIANTPKSNVPWTVS